MISTKKRLIISLFVLVLTVAFVNTPADARVWSNKTGDGFCDPCEDPPPTSGGSSLSGVQQTSSIEVLVIEGAGHYLKAYSGALLLANKVELSDLYGVNPEELKVMIDQTITDTQLTLETYSALVAKANATPYNENVIDKLTAFDYKAFKNEKGLNPNVFKKVEAFLSEGDIRGNYAYILERLDNLLGVLYQIKSLVDADSLPENEMMWRLHQQFSETLLFGQYTAEVFYRLADN
jgi:hypothetical protein